MKQIKPLPTTFNKYGYTFKQVWRDLDYAIYRQSIGDVVVGYELIKINIRQQTDYNPVPHEAYPSSSQWGIYGWTLPDLDKAYQKIQHLIYFKND